MSIYSWNCWCVCERCDAMRCGAFVACSFLLTNCQVKSSNCKVIAAFCLTELELHSLGIPSLLAWSHLMLRKCAWVCVLGCLSVRMCVCNFNWSWVKMKGVLTKMPLFGPFVVVAVDFVAAVIWTSSLGTVLLLLLLLCLKLKLAVNGRLNNYVAGM